MAVLLSAHQLSKSFAARPLFRDVTFSIESGERIGLIGPNGAGKSTLLKIIAGQTSPDHGTLSLQRGLRVGLLEQSPTFADKATLFATILEGTAQSGFSADDWEAQALVHEQISKFGLDKLDENTLLSTLSGGWKKRVALAREFVRKPDLLLLDEPTNHLDVETILWLEELLAASPFAVLTITHDRLFLQRVANRIIELDSRHEGGTLSVRGDYATFLEVRDQLITAQERSEVILKNTLRRETEWLRQGAKARTTKQQARINRAGELKDTVEDLQQRNQVRTARFDFQSTGKSPKKLIEAKFISKKYGDRTVFSDLDLMVTPGTRIGLLGPNGSGKSTLIRVLLGSESPSTGEITRSDQLQVAYFDQVRESLDPELTVSKTLCPRGDYVEYRGSRVHIKSYLDRFLFTKGQMDMKVGKLSGGEQSRLLVARLMLREANLLVLDEPTNDLDLPTLNVLEECLSDFPGAVILVAHDRYFLDQVANQILAFPPSDRLGTELVKLANLSQWEIWHQDELMRLEKLNKVPAQAPPVTQTLGQKVGTTRKKLSFKEQREFDTMEATIQAADEKLANLTRESESPEVMRNSSKLAEIAKEMATTQVEIDRLYARWAELEGK